MSRAWSKRSRLAGAVVLVAALAIAGCGGDRESAVETTTRPTLPRAVADDLAARSDSIADALDAGDVCTAAHRADELLAAVLAAINEDRVPREFQEDLTARANELVNTVNCPPPAPTTTEEDDGDDAADNGNNGKKDKDKDKDNQGGDGDEGGEDDPIVTLPDLP